MKKLLLVLALCAFSAVDIHAGTIFYQSLPAQDTDNGSGISTDSGYTSAVDGGNSKETDRTVNGITLYALKASGDSSTADNCTLNALSGSLSNAGGSTSSIEADGVMKDVLSDMTFNNGASDGSQQEIVLDPASLESGATYDLRIYICNSSNQNRMVSLSFVGDGQDAVETGFFNEDDARTSAGGFQNANQVYYINYRYTWDGDSTPGVTVTQKSGSKPFLLYALTNQLVPGGEAAAQGGGGGEQASNAVSQGAAAIQNAAAAAGGDEGVTEGQVDEGDDQVGVASDDFYNSDSLNSNGQWVDVEKWGKGWQPKNVPQGWCPYTNGSFQNCDTCGWTFVSDEPWAWACYHYGRWCKVSYGCGWCWIPGRVWAGSWVSWRRGEGEKCSCVGWAPLPPEAGCEWNVGISSWVDSSCNIGPECYTFIDVVNFGRESYFGCGCMYERSRNCTVIIDTFNCTNICHGGGGTYCGGPDFNWCNQKIREGGGRECQQVHVNRYDDPGKLGGKFSRHDGNSLGLVSPKIHGGNAKFNQKIAGNIKSNQIDHGWKNIKDPNAKQAAENHIARESKGKSPKNTKATLPTDVAKTRMAKHDGLAGAGGGGGKGNKQHPGKGNLAAGAQNVPNHGQLGGKQGKGQGNFQGAGKGNGAGNTGLNQHPGGVNKTAGGGNNNAKGNTGAGGFNQHPGKGRIGTAVSTSNASNAVGGAGTGAGKGGAKHPGQSLSGRTRNANQLKTGGSNAVGQQGGQHPGKGNKGAAGTGAVGTGQKNNQGTNGAIQKNNQRALTGGQGSKGQTSAGGGAGAGKKNRGQLQQQKTGAGQSAGQGGTGGNKGTTGGAGAGGNQGTTTQNGKNRRQALHAHGTSQTGGAVGNTGQGTGTKTGHAAGTKTPTQTQTQTQNRRQKLQAHPVQQQQQQLQHHQQQNLQSQQQLRVQQQQARQQAARPQQPQRRVKPTPTPH